MLVNWYQSIVFISSTTSLSKGCYGSVWLLQLQLCTAVGLWLISVVGRTSDTLAKLKPWKLQKYVLHTPQIFTSEKAHCYFQTDFPVHLKLLYYFCLSLFPVTCICTFWSVTELIHLLGRQGWPRVVAENLWHFISRFQATQRMGKVSRGGCEAWPPKTWTSEFYCLSISEF